MVLHALIGENDNVVRDSVRDPLRRYLAGFLSQSDPARHPIASAGADAAGCDALCAAAFDWYYEQAGLFGTPDRCRELVHELSRIGADEIACLLDFGVDPDKVLASLPYLNELREDSERSPVC